MRRFLALFFVFGAMSIASLAHAERRIALVIGNSVYQNTAELKNPKNDAGDMAASLRRLGFEVFEGHDLDKRSMERMIRQFGVKLSGADLALFFYAGHGVAVGGQNYLVPTDARLASEGDADFEGLPLTLVLKQMEREAKTSIVLLDACRDNPLARNLARTMGTRSSQVSQGLAEVRTGVGTLIGFSTQPGNVATDGTGRNSPYAEALLRHIEVSGTDVSGVLIAVRNDVLKATDGRQVPWEHTSLTGQVYLKVAPPSTPVAVRPPAANPGTYDREMEISYWSSVKDSKSPALLQSYLDRYPSGNFASLARAMLKELSPAAGICAAKRSAFIHRRQSRAGAFAANGAPARGLRSGRRRRQMAEQDAGGADAICASGQTGAVHRKAKPRRSRCGARAQEPRLSARLRCGQGRARRQLCCHHGAGTGTARQEESTANELREIRRAGQTKKRRASARAGRRGQAEVTSSCRATTLERVKRRSEPKRFPPKTTPRLFGQGVA